METQSPSLFIASDHAGWPLKKILLETFPEVTWKDLGCDNAETSVDYPTFADILAKEIKEPEDRGILICGSGQGMAIRANRHGHIRAALCWNEEIARLARQHNDANVLCLGARVLDSKTAVEVVRAFLNTEFEEGRHARRVSQLGKPTFC